MISSGEEPCFWRKRILCPHVSHSPSLLSRACLWPRHPGRGPILALREQGAAPPQRQKGGGPVPHSQIPSGRCVPGPGWAVQPGGQEPDPLGPRLGPPNTFRKSWERDLISLRLLPVITGGCWWIELICGKDLDQYLAHRPQKNGNTCFVESAT